MKNWDKDGRVRLPSGNTRYEGCSWFASGWDTFKRTCWRDEYIRESKRKSFYHEAFSYHSTTPFASSTFSWSDDPLIDRTCWTHPHADTVCENSRYSLGDDEKIRATTWSPKRRKSQYTDRNGELSWRDRGFRTQACRSSSTYLYHRKDWYGKIDPSWEYDLCWYPWGPGSRSDRSPWRSCRDNFEKYTEIKNQWYRSLWSCRPGVSDRI